MRPELLEKDVVDLRKHANSWLGLEKRRVNGDTAKYLRRGPQSYSEYLTEYQKDEFGMNTYGRYNPVYLVKDIGSCCPSDEAPPVRPGESLLTDTAKFLAIWGEDI